MTDMKEVIAPKSDQLNADSLIGGPITITIREVVIRPGTEQPVSIFYDGDEGNPWKPCKSMSRVMVAAWGPDANVYKGRSLTLYRDPSVKWAGIEVGGIRISHMSHMEGRMTMALTATKGSRKPYTVEPLQIGAVGLNIETAKTALNNAKDLDELRVIWSNKAMAPFRDALTDHLAERKMILSEQESTQSPTPESTPPDEGAETVSGRGEDAEKQIGAASSPLWSSLVEKAMFAQTEEEVIALQAEFDANEDNIPLDRLGEVQEALEAAMGRFAEGE